jgi:hypothetical protein
VPPFSCTLTPSHKDGGSTSRPEVGTYLLISKASHSSTQHISKNYVLICAYYSDDINFYPRHIFLP